MLEWRGPVNGGVFEVLCDSDGMLSMCRNLFRPGLMTIMSLMFFAINSLSLFGFGSNLRKLT